MKPKSFESRRNSFFTRSGCASCLRGCLGTMLLPQSYYNPNPSKGADCVGGQLHGDKKCPFSGVTKSTRVCRKVPESDARSVCCMLSFIFWVDVGVSGCCFGGADGCIPLIMFVDVCQCCWLLMFVCLPLSKHFPCCKTW